jgi:hypothetical protein
MTENVLQSSALISDRLSHGFNFSEILSLPKRGCRTREDGPGNQERIDACRVVYGLDHAASDLWVDQTDSFPIGISDAPEETSDTAAT